MNSWKCHIFSQNAIFLVLQDRKARLDLGDADLDLSALLFREDQMLVETIWFRNLKSDTNSIIHSGDNQTGEGEGDDEDKQER